MVPQVKREATVMVSQGLAQHGSRREQRVRALALVGLVLLLAGCTSGGDEGQATAPSAPSPRVERQAIDNLLALYQEAVVAEDSDRLQALLAPATALAPTQTTAAPRQDPTGAFADPAALQDTLRATFQQATVTALAIPPETVVIAPDQSSVTFLEVESTLDPADGGAAHAGVSHHLGAQPGGHGGGAPGDQRGQPLGAAGRGHDGGFAGGGAAPAADRAGADRGLCPGGGGGARAGVGRGAARGGDAGSGAGDVHGSRGHRTARPAGAGPGHER